MQLFQAVEPLQTQRDRNVDLPDRWTAVRHAAARPIAILLFAASLLSSQAAELPLFPIVENGKLGYMDSNGAVVIAPQFAPRGYDRGIHFSEGLEPVALDRGPDPIIGFIDRSGKFVIPPRFTQALPFSEGVARARETNGLDGYIDKTGHFVIPPVFEEADTFWDGLAIAETNQTWGYIDHTGAWAIPARFKSNSPLSSRFRDGMACMESNGLWGFIDKKGRFAIPPRFATPGHFSDGLAAVTEGDKYGYIDSTGRYAIPARFNVAWNFSEGIARVEVDDMMSFINKAGAVLFTVTNGFWANPFSQGLAAVSVRGAGGAQKWGFIDTAGKFVIAPQFLSAEDFRFGLAQVAVSNKLAYINRQGRYIWGPRNF